MNKPTAGTIRRLLIILIALSPLAYIASIVLILRHDPNTHAGISIDRGRAISLAAQFASTRGVDVTDWERFCRFTSNNDLLFYYRLRSGTERDLARRLAPEAVIGVRFRAPDRSENIEVLLGPDGRPLGYVRVISKSAELTDAGEETARMIAAEAIRARLKEAGRIPGPIDLTPSEFTGGGRQARKYVWQWPLSAIPELKLKSVIYVRGQTLIGDKIETEFDDVFFNRYLKTDSTSRAIMGIIGVLVTLIMVLFGIYRFVQRARQKEISYSRIVLLVVLYAAIISVLNFTSDEILYETSGNLDGTSSTVVILSTSLTFIFMLFIIGLAFGSGEGDVREAYPGKLTSLDALLSGKILSRNVARSAIFGLAIGGWLLFCERAISLPWERNPGYGRKLTILNFWFGPTPWLSPFLDFSIDVLLVTVIGLLLPLPLLHRHLRRKWLIITLLSIFIWVSNSISYTNFHPHSLTLTIAAVRTIFVLFSFFGFDLLTVIISLAPPSFIAVTTALVVQPSSTLRTSGLAAISTALVVLSLELICLLKGRLYSEDEVRPVYAKNLAERLFMQAEASAAREAQMRLLPCSLPQTPYFSVAASCLPAFEVGGDFYDLFEIGPGLIGVFIAEGGGKGLGSALSMAFAKGFLTPWLIGGRRSDDSPAEILRALQERMMARMAELDAGVGLAYAVIDAADGTVRYARTANYPVVLAGSAPALKQPEENAGGGLIEGSFALRPGESVVLYTDGIAKTWADSSTSPATEFTRVLDHSRNGDTERLRENLLKAVNESSKRAKKIGLEDDLTAVIVRLERTDDDT
ncbi:MAG: SpoIIE family protein phosphatase [Blastocatellia bacterium]|nr:SpoIIE family protein phosphatase [Blastocatellia bacterium]